MTQRYRGLNVLIVCKGNIIRSPFAEGVLRHLTLGEKVGSVTWLRSSGIEAFHIGAPADPTAIVVGREFGIDLTAHVARQINEEDVRWVGAIVVMEVAQELQIRERFGSAVADTKFIKLGDLVSPAVSAILDPYGQSADEFRSCFRLLWDGCTALVGSMSP